MNDILASIRDLHAHTGRYIEKALTDQRVIITHRGKPVAEIKSYIPQNPEKRSAWKDRYLTPAFQKLQSSGKLYWPSDVPSITAMISADREP